MVMETVGDVLDGLPGIGDNAGPALEMLRDKLEAQNVDLVKRKEALIASAGRMPEITNDDIAGKASDLVKMIGAAIKDSESHRKAGKAPYDALADVVHSFFKKGISDPLESAKKAVETKLGVHLRAKADRERRAREEAERLAREAERKAQEAARAAAEAMQNEKDLAAALDAQARADEAAIASVAASKAAAAKPAELARTRGDVGSLGTLRTQWSFKDLDRHAIDLERLRPYLSEDDLGKAIRGYIKSMGADALKMLVKDGNQPIRGVTLYEASEVTVR